MNVKDVMARDVRTVRMIDRADAAARVLWEQDCGVVPVVDGNQALVGIVTDRDLCMASYTQGRALAEIPLTAVMARSVRTCRPDDALATALATMQQHQVHRLPVVDARGVVVGMLTTNDLVRLAVARPAALDVGVVVKTFAAIGAPRRAAAARPPAVPAPAQAASAPAPAAAAAPAAVAIPAPAATLLPAAGKPTKVKGKSKGKKA